ncbi:MAG: class I SAM-dependent methyltransferase [Sphingomonadales bacterium]
MTSPTPDRDLRASFDIAARFYKWRVPYPANLFKGACDYLGLDRNASILDICCGAGELAAGFADMVGRVAAIDFSEQMLALAPRHERIEYIRHDINGETPLPDSLRDTAFGCFAIGRAIHWVAEANLARAAERNLKPDGCILICGSGFHRESPWVPVFRDFKERYAYPEGEKDHSGNAKLERIGFAFARELGTRHRTTVSLDDLTRHALSFARSAELIHRNLQRFRSELAAEMAPYLVDGRLEGNIVSWMNVYRRR